MEDKHRKGKKNIVYLKDVDTYDFGEAGTVSVLLDLIPDDDHKEITAKCKTTGTFFNFVYAIVPTASAASSPW